MATKTPIADPNNTHGPITRRARLWPVLGAVFWVGGERKFFYRKPLEPRETYDRDRSLNGKARIRARRAARRT